MDVIKIHHNVIRKIPLLTRAEEIHLSSRIQRGRCIKQPRGVFKNPLKGMTSDAQEACHSLVWHNLRLVPFVVKTFIESKFGPNQEDLWQEGTLGLYCAARKYDHTQGVRFSTYAVPWIRNFCIRCLRQGALIHTPPCADQGKYREQALMAQATHVAITASNQELLPLPSYDPEQSQPPVSAEQTELLLREIMALPARTSYILLSHFGLGGKRKRTLEEIGKIYNISKERVRQIQADALATLRRRLLDSELKREFSDW